MEVHHVLGGVAYPVASKQALSTRRPVSGVGVNDAPYSVRPKCADGYRVCPAYLKWHNMLKRCYQPRTEAVRRAYAGCSVSPEWHSFMAFRDWMTAQPDWQNRDLDKDIRVPGNRVYGPNTCLMVPHRVNNLLRRFPARSLPVGVCLDGGRYRVQVADNGTQRGLGTYATPEEASEVYLDAKRRHLMQAALPYLDEPELYAAIADCAAFVHETYASKAAA